MQKHGWHLGVFVYGWCVTLLAQPNLVGVESTPNGSKIPCWLKMSTKLAIDRKHQFWHSVKAKRAVVKIFRNEALVDLSKFGVTDADLGNYLTLYDFNVNGDNTKSVLAADLKNNKFRLNPVEKYDTLHFFSPMVHESVFVAEGKLIIAAGDLQEETIKAILSSDVRKDLNEYELAKIEINIEQMLKGSGFSVEKALDSCFSRIGVQRGNYSGVPWLKTYGKVMEDRLKRIDDIISVSLGLEVENGLFSLNAKMIPKQGSSFQKFALANEKRSIGSFPFVPDDAMLVLLSNISPESIAEWSKMELDADLYSQPLSMPERQYICENHDLMARYGNGLTTFAINRNGEEQVGATLYLETEKSGLILDGWITGKKILSASQTAVEYENARRIDSRMQDIPSHPSLFEFSDVLLERSGEMFGPLFAGLYYTTESHGADFVHIFTRHIPSRFIEGRIFKIPFACCGAVDGGIVATFGDECRPVLVKYLDGYRHNVKVEKVIKDPVIRSKSPWLFVESDIGALYANTGKISELLMMQSKDFYHGILQKILGDENGDVIDEIANLTSTLGTVSFALWTEQGQINARLSLSKKAAFTIRNVLEISKKNKQKFKI
jgi:hypothetical protein